MNKVVGWGGAILFLGTVSWYSFKRFSGVKALIQNVRGQLVDIDLTKMISTRPRLTANVQVDNNSEQRITLDNIIATLYKVEANGAETQLVSNSPISKIQLPANKRTKVPLQFDIPLLSAGTTLFSAFSNKGKENYVLKSSIVILNQTQQLEPVKFSV